MNDLIRFKGKNISKCINLNLLCKERNIYIMDNHNAAMWSWLQEIDLVKKYNILHIDRHYDTRASHIEQWINNIPKNINKLSIDEYLALEYEDPNFGNITKIMWWDNYFPIFHRLFKDNINGYHFFTHKEGSIFCEMEDMIEHYSILEIFNNIEDIFEDEKYLPYKWIVNIDLDYFFQRVDDKDITFRFISKTAIEFLLQIINNNLKKKIEVITIALSPECCGNWEQSLNLMNLFADKLNINFNIK